MSADAAAMLVAAVICISLATAFGAKMTLAQAAASWPVVMLAGLCYSVARLYSASSLNPPDELRKVASCSLVLFLVAESVNGYGSGMMLPTTFWLAALLLNVILLPVFRSAVRMLWAHEPWWGFPAVVFGTGEAGIRAVECLRRQPSLGVKPVTVVDFGRTDWSQFRDLAVVRSTAHLRSRAESGTLSYAVIAAGDSTPDELREVMERQVKPYFPCVLIFQDKFERIGFNGRMRSVSDFFALEVIMSGSNSSEHLGKRILDIAGSILAFVLLSPLFALIALAIKLDSPGPVFYGHKRVGRHEAPFYAWKFRTMSANQQGVLEAYFKKNPEGEKEWRESMKLRDDPRVTPLGRFLRRTSLDELPQLWNVLVNDMSLVGPRPIVEAEIERYGDSYASYTSVKGGITGLWQISGRNDVSYDMRVRLDRFYSSNWSLWLDLYIICQTIIVVLFRRGAY
jgi:Undecaprenyl-phosphate galactose phosphotransferase WbaP